MRSHRRALRATYALGRCRQYPVKACHGRRQPLHPRL